MSVLEETKEAWDNSKDLLIAGLIGVELSFNMRHPEFFTLSTDKLKYPFLQLLLWKIEDFEYLEYLRQLTCFVSYADSLSMAQMRGINKSSVLNFLGRHREEALFNSLYGGEEPEFIEYARKHCLDELEFKSKKRLRGELYEHNRQIAIRSYFSEGLEWDTDLMGPIPRDMKKIYINK